MFFGQTQHAPQLMGKAGPWLGPRNHPHSCLSLGMTGLEGGLGVVASVHRLASSSWNPLLAAKPIPSLPPWRPIYGRGLLGPAGVRLEDFRSCQGKWPASGCTGAAVNIY